MQKACLVIDGTSCAHTAVEGFGNSFVSILVPIPVYTQSLGEVNVVS